jgi:hypothetical protein
MLNRSAKTAFAATVLLPLGLLAVGGAKADDAHCFTLASLKGTYAIVASYEGDVASAVGVRHIDEEGNLTGTFVLNEPVEGSATGARKIVTGTQKGTLTVNCDGTGVVTRTVTASNGVVAHQLDDFVITQAIEKDGRLRVTAMQDIEREASALVPGGVLVTRVWTRVPDPNEEQ